MIGKMFSMTAWTAPIDKGKTIELLVCEVCGSVCMSVLQQSVM